MLGKFHKHTQTKINKKGRFSKHTKKCEKYRENEKWKIKHTFFLIILLSAKLKS